RSKSRSVDHGFSPPFDLDSLRSKVEGRFESVGRDSKYGVSMPPTYNQNKGASDTLTSVAARFDTTPSELTKLNRLTTRLIFPGQVLYVPDKQGGSAQGDEGPGTSVDDGEGSVVSTPTATHQLEGDTELLEEKDILDNLRPVSPKPLLPGHIERVTTPLSPLASHIGAAAPSSEADDRRSVAEQRNCERFLKINVRHITDGQGVVGGVLLVTPNAVMFDPNVSDPLVIEHGPESYGVIAPMEFVVNAAIYYDIAHMRVGHTSDLPRSDVPKPEIYHAHGSHHRSAHAVENPQNSPGKDSLLVKDETVCSCGASGREGDAFPKAFERDLVTPTNLMLLSSSDNEASDREKIYSVEDDKTPVDMFHTLEERRRSCLDHHWAIPSIDRSSVDKENDDIVITSEETCSNSNAVVGENVAGSDETDRQGQLVKLSCHDSGIDIRDASVLDSIGAGSHVLPSQIEPDPVLPQTKKLFSDADIINASTNDWIPPKTVAELTSVIDTIGIQSGDAYNRKKTSSVSFSLDSNAESSGEGTCASDGKEGAVESGQKLDDSEKPESRKNKMLKRLSYPLAWMEGLTSEKDEKEALSSVPNSADSQHHSSVFSKVFSSSPINLVSDFSTGLFLTKTPSEESSKSPGPGPPPPTPAPDIESKPFLCSFFSYRRSSVGTFIRPHSSSSYSDTRSQQSAAPKLDYRSMVSVDDMPELFVSFDKLIPRPARSCEDPPLYLRLRMGKPINKKIPKSTPIMSYGKKKMRPEFWFSVPRNRVDDLYNFLLLWVPHLYGELEEMDPKSRGYELVESDTELWEDEAGESGPGGKDERRESDEGELSELTRESWEVLSMSEELRRALYASNAASLDIELFLPDLVGVTEIFSEEHRKKLCRHLPARAEGYVWTLVFSTSQHGFSLNSLYRKMNRLESPILMVIEDTEHNVFGALTSCALKVSDHFYGTGESLLFRFTPEFQVFNWTGDNMYFIKGNNESLAIGAGDGKFGLWLDGDLYQGRTQRCNTYGNEPLAPQEDFVVKTMECWAFI
ncbi:Oxidation resistance protein 1, partial [Zootermopsis nevadensis]